MHIASPSRLLAVTAKAASLTLPGVSAMKEIHQLWNGSQEDLEIAKTAPECRYVPGGASNEAFAKFLIRVNDLACAEWHKVNLDCEYPATWNMPWPENVSSLTLQEIAAHLQLRWDGIPEPSN